MLNKFYIFSRYYDCSEGSIIVSDNNITLTIECNKEFIEKVEKYLKRGDLIAINGTLSNRNTLIASKIMFLSSYERNN